MAATLFALDLVLDSVSYAAARGSLGERQVAVSWVPKITAASTNVATGDPTLDPIEYTTWHRGAGASRTVGVMGMVAYGENMWTVDPGVLLPGPEITSVTLPGATATPRPDGVSEADGAIFVAAGRYVYKLAAGQATAPTPTQDLDLGMGNIGQSIKRFGGGLFLSSVSAAGVGLNLQERPDGGAWTSAMPGTVPVQPTGALGTVWWTTGAAGASITAERLAAQFGSRGVRYCSSNPRLDTSWTPGLAIPAIDIGAPIQRFCATLDHLYVACTNGLRDLDSSGMAPNLIPEAEIGALPSGGLAAIAVSGYAYYSGGYDLYRVTIAGQQYALGTTVTPMAMLPNETPVGGYGTAMLARGKFLIYAQYDPILDTSWIMWGREASAGDLSGRAIGDSQPTLTVRGPELGPMVWNVAPIVLHGWKVTALWISGLATDGPRLWMFGQTQAGAVSAKWAPLAYTTPYADLKAGRARRFAQSCFLMLPAEDGGDSSFPKDVEEILQESENLTAGNSITVSAAKEGESTFTQLGAFTSGPRALARVSSAFVTSRPTFKISMLGSPVSPPIGRRTAIRWLPNPDRREIRRYLLLLGRDERMGSGNRSAQGADEQVSVLVGLATAASRVTLIDEAGVALIVRVLKVEGPTEVEADESGSRELTLALTLSVFGMAPGATFNYDSGIQWSSNRSWS